MKDDGYFYNHCLTDLAVSTVAVFLLDNDLQFNLQSQTGLDTKRQRKMLDFG